jgi:CBS domain containing-hemolysin-like protein
MEDGSFAFEGRTTLKDFYKILEIEGEEFERDKGDSETIGGFIVEQSGRILKNKESITQGNFKLSVISSDKRRIKWVKVQLL